MITLEQGHIEISPVKESIKKLQSKVKHYLQLDGDLVEIFLR